MPDILIRGDIRPFGPICGFCAEMDEPQIDIEYRDRHDID
jgi:hypothetical protein